MSMLIYDYQIGQRVKLTPRDSRPLVKRLVREARDIAMRLALRGRRQTLRLTDDDRERIRYELKFMATADDAEVVGIVPMAGLPTMIICSENHLPSIRFAYAVLFRKTVKGKPCCFLYTLLPEDLCPSEMAHMAASPAAYGRAEKSHRKSSSPH
jgi:hypothetical protein